MYNLRLALLTFVVAVFLATSTTIAEDKGDERIDGAQWLAQGFEANDSQPLVRFLKRWHERHRPATDKLLAKKPDFEREAYQVYKAFFAPSKKALEKPYVIVQSKLRVTLVNDDLSGIFTKMGLFEDGGIGTDDRVRRLPTISVVTLGDFRPAVSVNGPKTLYLTRDHLGVLLEFLVGKAELEDHFRPLEDHYWEIEHGDNIFFNEEGGDEELKARKRKLDYLNTQLSIIPGHWGTGWHFETHPAAFDLYLNQDRTKAVILYRQGYGGGETYLKKTDNGQWKVLLRSHNWVE